MARAIRNLGLAFLLAAGCRHHVSDISNVVPYSGYIGVTYRLNARAELLDHNSTPPGYSILSDRVKGASDEWVVAQLPEGYEIQVEAVRRDEGTMLIGGDPYKDEYAVVSLVDPVGRKRRIHATISVENLESMRPSSQEPPPYSATGQTPHPKE